MADDVQNVSENHGSETPFILPEMLGIANALEFQDILKQFQDKEQTLLDASKVISITTPCVQLLLSFIASVKAQGLGVSIIQPSDAFTAVMQDLGIAANHYST